MLKNNYKNETAKLLISFISIILFVYILLFEFILPINKFLPKPSILFESIPSLFNDYNFISSLTFSVSVIYSVMFISYFMIRLSSNLLLKLSIEFPKLGNMLVIGKYFIPLFLLFLFELWFGNSIWGEYIFFLIILMGELKLTTFNNLHKMSDVYLISAKSLGLKENEIINKVIWKTLQPSIFDTLQKKHITFWSLIIIYEFICKTDGIGNTFRLALKYNDISIIIVLIIMIILIVLLMEVVLNSIKKKYFYWES